MIRMFSICCSVLWVQCSIAMANQGLAICSISGNDLNESKTYYTNGRMEEVYGWAIKEGVEIETISMGDSFSFSNYFEMILAVQGEYANNPDGGVAGLFIYDRNVGMREYGLHNGDYIADNGGPMEGLFPGFECRIVIQKESCTINKMGYVSSCD